jgi:hypothetical protein
MNPFNTEKEWEKVCSLDAQIPRLISRKRTRRLRASDRV